MHKKFLQPAPANTWDNWCWATMFALPIIALGTFAGTLFEHSAHSFYYQIVRVVCFIVFGFLGVMFFSVFEHRFFSGVFSCLSILYNPFWKIHLYPDSWLALNAISVCLLIATVVFLAYIRDKEQKVEALAYPPNRILMASADGNLETVRMLLKADPCLIGARDQRGITPLHLAIDYGHKIIVHFLLSLKANPNTLDNWGQSPLHYAAEHRDKEIVEDLLKNGADVNAKDTNGGWYPIHRAIADDKIVQLLLAHGANIEAKMSAGNSAWTPLLWAAANHCEATLRVLLDSKCDVGARTNGGWTALHYCAQGGRDQSMKLLLDYGADVNAMGNDGKTALRAAYSGPTDEAIQKTANILREYGAKEDIFTAVAVGDTKFVEALIDENSQTLHAKDQNGYSPLHEAVSWNQQEMVKLLLAKGADANAKGTDGLTPLHTAALRGIKEIVGMLLDHRANVNAKSKNGVRPLRLADNTEVAEILRKHGARK